MHVVPWFLFAWACSGSALPPAPSCAVTLASSEGGQALVYDLAFHPDGTGLATGSTGALRYYDLRDDLLEEIWRDTSPTRFNSVQITVDGLLLAPTGEELRAYQIVDGAPQWAWSLPVAATGSELQRVSIDEAGRTALLCDTDGALHLVSLLEEPARVVATAEGVHRRCTRVHLSPDGAMAVSTGHDGDVVLTGVGDTLVELDRYPMGGESGEARFAPRGSLVYAGGFEPPFALVELQVSDARLVPQRMHPEHRSGVGSIDHDPSGTWLVTGDHDHGVHLYDIGPFGSLGHRTSLPVDGRGVHTVRFSPDGSRLARTASRVDEVELLDLMPCVAE